MCAIRAVHRRAGGRQQCDQPAAQPLPGSEMPLHLVEPVPHELLERAGVGAAVEQPDLVEVVQGPYRHAGRRRELADLPPPSVHVITHPRR
jgi:hypothetical protein